MKASAANDTKDNGSNDDNNDNNKSKKKKQNTAIHKRDTRGPAAFEVDELRAEQQRGDTRFYLVKWTGYDEEHNTCEPDYHICAEGLITKFNGRKKEPWKWSYHVGVAVNDKQPGWHDFDQKAATVVEAAYVKWLNNPGGAASQLTLTVGKYNYKIDLAELTQTNLTHDNHTVRKLRRA